MNAILVYNKMSNPNIKRLIVFWNTYLVANSAHTGFLNLWENVLQMSQLSCMISSMSHPLLVGIFHYHHQKDPDWLIFSRCTVRTFTHGLFTLHLIAANTRCNYFKTLTQKDSSFLKSELAWHGFKPACQCNSYNSIPSLHKMIQVCNSRGSGRHAFFQRMPCI